MRDKIELDRSLLNQKLAEYYTSVNEPFYHCYELCLIPDFAEGEQPSWDEASRWLCSFAEYDSWTVLRAYARHFGYTEENMPEMDVPAALQALFSGEYVKDEFGKVLRLKPDEELRPSEKLRVTFRLFGDKNLPFTYLSAER